MTTSAVGRGAMWLLFPDPDAVRDIPMQLLVRTAAFALLADRLALVPQLLGARTRTRRGCLLGLAMWIVTLCVGALAAMLNMLLAMAVRR